METTQMTNAPSLRDFIAECVGHRDWYTAALRCPAYEARRGLSFIPAKAFAEIKARYAAMFGA